MNICKKALCYWLDKALPARRRPAARRKDGKVDSYTMWKNAARDIIAAAGEDLTREGLRNTPERVARSYEYLLRGYHQNLEDVVPDRLDFSGCRCSHDGGGIPHEHGCRLRA